MDLADSRAVALTRLVDWAAPRLRWRNTEAVSGLAAAIAMDTGVPCHLLLAAARHYGSWNNSLPRFSVDGDGSEATI
eukprot:14592958-Alexandrium_andersonii.AAC.1